MISWVVLLALLALLAQQIQYARRLRVKAVISRIDKITLGTASMGLAGLAYFLADSILEYLIAGLAIALIVADCHKQGLCDLGVLLVARGKELYRWEEIGAVILQKGETIAVEYRSPRGAKITSHRYKLEDDAQIQRMLKDQGIGYEIQASKP